ncbi:hypothetical protein V5O48_012917 [Marasmius crinis-equi]|uniref:Uncharacterized protein n=1 Tax=Marasmius crinis-equi TaxID=585013 RepID=A0ABR3F1I4_9AGAR
MNVIDAAKEPGFSEVEKAEEAVYFLKKLANHDFVLDTGSSTNKLSKAIQKVATELDGATARLNPSSSSSRLSWPS